MRYVVHGRYVSKKNGKEIRVGRGGHRYIGSSTEFLDWQNDAIMELRAQRSSTMTIADGKVGIAITLFLAKGQREFDIDNLLGGIFDALQAARIVANDRQFVLTKSPEQFRDPADPRIEVELEPLGR